MLRPCSINSNAMQQLLLQSNTNTTQDSQRSFSPLHNLWLSVKSHCIWGHTVFDYRTPGYYLPVVTLTRTLCSPSDGDERPRRDSANEQCCPLWYDRLMEGGAESGFRQVAPEKYTPRLFHFHGTGKNVVVKEVSLRDSTHNHCCCHQPSQTYSNESFL